jgi:hypothetical protein
VTAKNWREPAVDCLWRRKPTREELDDLRRDAVFTSEKVGAPGSKVRLRALALLRLLDHYEGGDRVAPPK